MNHKWGNVEVEKEQEHSINSDEANRRQNQKNFSRFLEQLKTKQLNSNLKRIVDSFFPVKRNKN